MKASLKILASVVLALHFTNSLSQKNLMVEEHFRIRQSPDVLQYLLYKPNSYTSNTPLPLLVYLHGTSTVGDDLSLSRQKGIPGLVEAGYDFPFLIICPQLPLSMNKNWDANFVDEFVKYAIEKYAVDKNRIYITGFSIGGTGVWEYVCAFPDKVACAVPISGWGNPHDMCKIKKVPVWAFHGSDDLINRPIASRNLTAALKKCGGDVRLTELEGVGHDSWKAVYTYPDIFNWMLAQNKTDTLKRRDHVQIDKNTIAYKLPKALFDITGLTVSGPGEFYGINGSRSLPAIINFDTAGRVKKMIRVRNASNLSWQDITRADNGYLFIADAGNENFRRKSYQIYKIKLPELDEETTEAFKIEFTLPGTLSLNFRSIFYYKEYLYLFGDDSNNETYLVQVEPVKETKATIVCKYPGLKLTLITSSFFDVKRDLLFLLFKEKMGVIHITNGLDSLIEPVISFVDFTYKSGKEGISCLPDGSLIYADQNFLGTSDGNLYLMQFRE